MTGPHGERVAASTNPRRLLSLTRHAGKPLVPRAQSQNQKESEKVLDIPFHSNAGSGAPRFYASEASSDVGWAERRHHGGMPEILPSDDYEALVESLMTELAAAGVGGDGAVGEAYGAVGWR